MKLSFFSIIIGSNLGLSIFMLNATVFQKSLSSQSHVQINKQPSPYVGPEKCGSCHAAEYASWRATPHANAVQVLSASAKKDGSCLNCHATAADVGILSVSCESCHGSGHLYWPDFVMKDKKLAHAAGLKAITKSTCTTCHSVDAPNVAPFIFETDLLKVNHGQN